MSTDANTPANSQLGRETAYPEHYDASLLFPIPRRSARAEIGIREAALPFTGHDRWHAYEISWLDPLGKPQAATATFTVAASSPNLIESKSFKLYLNSLNQSVWASAETLRQQIETDLSAVAASAVTMQWGLPPLEADAQPRHNIDSLPITIEDYGPPNPAHLSADPSDMVTETLHSALLKSNCPVTGQPDWASLHLHYRGPRIDPAGLLRYLASFRNHREFHEQCVERIFVEVLARCAPEALSVEARYTRRGGLDINPWRATPGLPAPTALRDARQ